MKTVRSLGEIITPAQAERCGDGSYPVLSITMHDGIVLQADRFKKKLASVDTTWYKVVRRGQLVESFPIDEGVIYVQDVVDAGIMSPAYRGYDINTEIVNAKYLELALHSPYSMNYYKEKLRGTPARRRSLPKETMMALEIDVPSLAEQGEIVARLDGVEALLTNRRAALSALDTLVKSRFQSQFGDPVTNERGWEMRKLNDLGEWTSGGTPSRKNPEYFTGDINWFSAGELNTIYISDSLEKITKEAVDNSAAKIFTAGSMLVGMYDTAAFKMSILTKDSASNQACACIAPNDTVNIVWLYFALTEMKPHFLSQRRGVRQKNLNLSMIKDFAIPVPPIEEQNKFAAFVAAVERLRAQLTASPPSAPPVCSTTSTKKAAPPGGLFIGYYNRQNNVIIMVTN